jgi:hypothetical protein
MIRREIAVAAAGPITFTATALGCGVMAVASYDGMAGLTSAALVVGGGGLAALATRVLASLRGSGLAVTGHSHGDTRARVAVHEAGHYVAGTSVGGRVKSAVIYASGGGYVAWRGPGGDYRTQVVAVVAFLDAGRQALGSPEGCGSDRHSIKRALKFLPAKERSAARREGEAWAGRIVASQSGEIARVAARLTTKSRIR